jgi:Flp pilus assembly protein TadD
VAAARALILGGLAIIGALIFVLTRATRAPTKTAPPTIVRSIAVVPAADSGDTANQWLVRGVAAEVDKSLRSVHGVRVVRAPAGGNVPASRLRELLNVGALVLLRVDRDSPAQMRVTLRSGRDSVLLRRTYGISPDGVLAAEDAIATDVANALRADLGMPSIRGIVVAGTRDPAAHELYLRGRYDGAVRADPRYAEAWAAMAREHARHSAWDSAATAAERAIAIDSSLASPRVVLAARLRHEDQPERAEAEYLKAIRLDPQLASARHEYSLLLAERRRVNDALREARRAHELDPLSPEIHGSYARMLMLAGRNTESVHEEAERRRVAGVLQRGNSVSRVIERSKNAKQTSRGGSRRGRRK